MTETNSNPFAIMQTSEYGTALAEIQQDLLPMFSSHPQGERALQEFLGALYLHFRRTPQLQRCTKESIKSAVMDMALLGLDIRNPGEAWLIPYDVAVKDDRGNKTGQTELTCTMQAGYIGKRKIALSHPAVKDAWAESVYENDTFIYHGKRGMPEHMYSPFKPRGALIGFYAVVELEGDVCRCEVMSLDEVKAHRDQYSKSKRSTFWAEEYTEYDRNGKAVGTHPSRTFEQMCLKTVLAKVCHSRVIPMTDAARRHEAEEQRVERDVTNTRQVEYLPKEGEPTAEDAAEANGALFGEEMPPAVIDHRTEQTEHTDTEEAAQPSLLNDASMPPTTGQLMNAINAARIKADISLKAWSDWRDANGLRDMAEKEQGILTAVLRHLEYHGGAAIDHPLSMDGSAQREAHNG